VFRVGGISAALPLREIREVIRPPEILAVPLSPPTVEGLINLRGAVTVLINLRRVLGLAVGPADEGARIIVLGSGARLGLHVDRITGIVDLTPGGIERSDDPGDSNLFSGTVPGDERHPPISLLALDRVLGRLATAARRAPFAAAKTTLSTGPAVAPAAAPAAIDMRMLVSFEADGEEYAVPVSAVREIVRPQAKIARMPHADGHLLGVITLRGRLVPLFELRTLMGLTLAGRGEDVAASRIIVLSFSGLQAGLVVDRAREILRVRSDHIDPLPPLFRQNTGEIEAICWLDQGKRLISILDPDRLFRSEAVRRTLAANSDRLSPDVQLGVQPDVRPGVPEEGMAKNRAGMTLAGEPFVIFRLGGVEYGLPSSCVEQVVAVPERLTTIPKAPDFIEGVINHRGSVLPVIDQRRRFAMSGSAGVRSRRIIVTAIGATRAGILVDAVTGVLKIPGEAIEPAPELSAEQVALISRVANLGDRMILLLDPAHLLARHEAEQIAVMDDPETGPASGPAAG
jgi:purine-binding chemotaxis protein CheW